MKKATLLVYALIFVVSSIYADEKGTPFMTSYTPNQTGGHFQNWALAQDNRGLMYIGNGYGVQEFDGSTWRLIPLPNGSFASSFAKDSTGRIYVGSAAEVGYLAPDEKGEMQYVSLLDQIPVSERGFTYVLKTLATPEGIYFQTVDRLFRFNWILPDKGKQGTWKVKIWRPGTQDNFFQFICYVDQKLYVQHNVLGLMTINGDSLNPLQDGRDFLNYRLRFMIPLPGRSKTYLLGTSNKGLILYDGYSLKPFHTDADVYLKEGLIDGKILKDSLFGLSTLAYGFIIIDQSGKIKLSISTSSGLPSNVIRSCLIDRQDNIWLAMDGGISILEYQSNLSLVPLPGNGVVDLIRYRGTLFASCADGIFYLDTISSQFKNVPGTPRSQASLFCIAKGNLYYPTLNTIIQVDRIGGQRVIPEKSIGSTITYLHLLSDDNSRLLVGTMNGVAIVRIEPDQKQKLRFERIIPGIYETISKIIEPQPGVFWLGTYDAGVIRLHFEDNDFNRSIIERFGPEQGLPLATTLVNLAAGKMVFSTIKGFYMFDEKMRQFHPDPFFKDLKLGVNPGESMVAADEEGNIWANGGKETAFYKLLQGGTYQFERDIFARFGEQLLTVIYPEKGGTTWLGFTNNIVRYKKSTDQSPPVSWSAMIRSVNSGNDSTLYYGGCEAVKQRTVQPTIPFRFNSIAFEYTGLSYIKPEANEFRIMLEGYDRDWSAWSRDTKRNYTNLSPGTYTFRVNARNISGQESNEASYTFTILSPWYRTWLAYLIYTCTFVLAIFGLVRYRTRKLRARSIALEKIVEQRTAQIQEQKNNVEQLSRIGKDITSSLSIENIIQTVYENVNTLMDASIFTIGLHKPEENSLIFPAAIEKSQLLPPFSVPLSDENRLAAWCFHHRQEVVINDYELEYTKYVRQLTTPIAGETPESILYLPLWNKEKVIGVISAQSFSKDAYTDYHVNILRNLATYSAIALENADAYKRLATLLDELKTTQNKLITQSKLAALGSLTAGIAHEIKNPLNFVNNFAGLNVELIEELQGEVIDGKENIGQTTLEEIKNILNTLKQNSSKIREHGKRADSIVYSMLQHSRGGSGEPQSTDINALLEEAINLTYHGMRAQYAGFNISIEKSLDESIGKMQVIPQELSRAFLNIISNGCYEAHRKKMEIDGNFSPTITVLTQKLGKQVKISIRDNGNGIPEAIREKLFTPFFTTKPAGQGTGLGLSIAYDIIVHQHKGQISFKTEENSFTEFVILLPYIHT